MVLKERSYPDSTIHKNLDKVRNGRQIESRGAWKDLIARFVPNLPSDRSPKAFRSSGSRLRYEEFSASGWD